MSARRKDSSPASVVRAGFVPSLATLVVAGLMAVGCGASPRSIAVDATTIAHDAVDESAPKLEKMCIVELPELKEPQWSERSGICDVAVPAHDALALAVIAAKKAIKVASGDAALLVMAAELATAVADFTASMVKLVGAK